MPLLELICSHCGAKIELDNSKNSYTCQYCGSSFVIEIDKKQVPNYHQRFNSCYDDILNTVLDVDEDTRFLEAKKAFENHDHSECEKICNEILLHINSDSRKTRELLVEDKFRWSFREYPYRKCLDDIFDNTENAKKEFEKFVRYSDCVRGYFLHFNDSEAKSFILNFKNKISLSYNYFNSKKVPIKEYLDDALSKNKYLKFAAYYFGDYYCFYLWKDATFYYIADAQTSLSYRPRIYIFRFSSSGEFAPCNALERVTEKKSSFWGGFRDFSTYEPIESTANRLFENFPPYCIDGYIRIGNVTCPSIELNENEQKGLDIISTELKKIVNHDKV